MLKTPCCIFLISVSTILSRSSLFSFPVSFCSWCFDSARDKPYIMVSNASPAPCSVSSSGASLMFFNMCSAVGSPITILVICAHENTFKSIEAIDHPLLCFCRGFLCFKFRNTGSMFREQHFFSRFFHSFSFSTHASQWSSFVLVSQSSLTCAFPPWEGGDLS